MPTRAQVNPESRENIFRRQYIHVGQASVPYGQSKSMQLGWFLPGGNFTQSREVATNAAKQLDRVISASKKVA